ncbi:MAG: hypothetical protein BGO26_15475 [Actinobacteria bacterium 69-20]|nr:cellulase family glycosylhydrolase [Actinomycetota bacterium]OJV28718.1 MAG: hypothetical protein BGO26_15475 [Actinobacteria bacterium 69-20]
MGRKRAAEFWQRFRGTFIDEQDLAQISAEGFNHVRLPINWRVIMTGDGRPIDEGLAHIDRLVKWCRAHRLWAVLDLHGAPGGQTGTNIDDSPNGKPELFTDSTCRSLTIRLWQLLALRYRDETAVAAYDLLNEPLPNDYQHAYAADLAVLYQDLTAAIREIDPHHLISYEGAHWATNWDIFTDVWDQNSLLQFHKYWSPPDRPSIAPYLDARDRLGLPIYMGEGGENNLAWVQTAFQLYDDCGISWNFWPWKKLDTITSPVSINAPAGWQRLADYATGQAPLPRDEAWQILTGLLDALPTRRCSYRAEVINAILRRPPLDIPATGFAFRGPGITYQTTGATPRTDFRGDDRVTIRHQTNGTAAAGKIDFHHDSGTPRHPGDELLLHLALGDWITYEVNTLDPARLEITVTVVTDHHPDRRDPALAIAVDGNAILIMPTGPSSSDDDYETIHTTTPLAVPAGRHDIRLTAHATEILISSIRVTPSTAS